MGTPQNQSAGGDLHAAARSGDLSAVQALLGSTLYPLILEISTPERPAWSGQADVVSYLCKHKADVVSYLCKHKADVVSYLCKHKADVGAAAVDDMGATHFAAQKGHLEVVKTLLSSGISVKASTRKVLTPLHYAAQSSNLELVKYLVKKGSNLKAKTKAGKIPLDLAKNEEIISFQEECEGSGKVEESSGGESPAAEVKEGKDQIEKRKGDEDVVGEASSEPKKAKVMLNHLVSIDDNPEDELS